jgi:monoamine oxidase
LSTVLQSGLWSGISAGMGIDHQSAIFQPVGGMENVAKGFEKHVGDIVRLNSKVVSIQQDAKGVVVTYEDTKTGARMQAKADYCICTIPLSVLSQIEMNVSDSMSAAIQAVPYEAGFKVGLEFKRRFWEQDEQICWAAILSAPLPMNSPRCRPKSAWRGLWNGVRKSTRSIRMNS